ncbi:unnamed protein product, partial [Ceratitis capitata]
MHVRYREETLQKASRENVIKAISETIRFLVRTVHGKTIEYEDASWDKSSHVELEHRDLYFGTDLWHGNYDRIL